MRTWFHVTSASAAKKIQKEGLTLQRIRRGKFATSQIEERVYVFQDLATAEDAVVNWLGDLLPEDEGIVIFAVDLPAGTVLHEDPELAGSFYLLEPVPSTQLHVVYRE